MKHRALIAFLTDFGMADSYVASMKGVIAGIAPETRIIDLSHDVPPQGIDHAAYLLWSCYTFFPARTIFLCVVDPGVGTGRRILLAESRGYRFLAPDNGLLKFIIGADPEANIVEVTNRKYFLEPVSSTFHGRDIFAPVAAHLSTGTMPARLGPPSRSSIMPEAFIRMSARVRTCHARIVYVDRFGNLITNLIAARPGLERISVRVGTRWIRRSSGTYADAGLHRPFLIAGSTGLLEISVRNGSAARALDAGINQPITITIS